MAPKKSKKKVAAKKAAKKSAPKPPLPKINEIVHWEI